MEERSPLQRRQGGNFDDSEASILVAQDSPAVSKRVTSVSRKGWLRSLLGARQAPHHTLTVYYPYYFQSWRVTIPKSLGREARVRLVTGVNGMSRSTGHADTWPAVEDKDEKQLGDHRVISPRTSEAEAGELAREYVDKFLARRYRPAGSPKVEREEFALIYVPYYVLARGGQPLHRAALVEGFTGALGKVKDVPEIREALMDGGAFYLPFIDPLGLAPSAGSEGNPFAAGGLGVIVGAVVMAVATPLTTPMPQEHVSRVFGDRPSPQGGVPTNRPPAARSI